MTWGGLIGLAEQDEANGVADLGGAVGDRPDGWRGTGKMRG